MAFHGPPIEKSLEGKTMKKLIALLAPMMFASLAFSLPNPAAIYCIQQGGTYEVRTDSVGNQGGVCLFNQRGELSECGGWALFDGRCYPGDCAHWSVEENSCATL